MNPSPPLSVADASKLVTRADIIQALSDLDARKPHAFGDSIYYDLVFQGRRYPPKAVFGLALARHLGRAAVPSDFSAGENSLCFQVLRSNGFTIENKSNPGLPETPSPRVWVEVTTKANKTGGPGWGLGECLWSPCRNSTGADSYSTMRAVQPGDLVLHLADSEWTGFSFAVGRATETTAEPPQPGPWAGRSRYYRILLEQYQSFTHPLPLASFLKKYAVEIRNELANDAPAQYPFVEQGGNLITRQGGYLSRCTERLYRLILNEVVAQISPANPSTAQVATPPHRFWVIGAGENGRLWNQFQEHKIAAIGWDHLGDLSKYPTFDEIKAALAAARSEPDAPDPINDAVSVHG